MIKEFRPRPRTLLTDSDREIGNAVKNQATRNTENIVWLEAPDQPEACRPNHVV